MKNILIFSVVIFLLAVFASCEGMLGDVSKDNGDIISTLPSVPPADTSDLVSEDTSEEGSRDDGIISDAESFVDGLVSDIESAFK